MQSSIVQKLLHVLSVISEAQRPLTFSEVVEKTGLNKSTIHRILAISTEEKMVRYDPHHKVYVLGTRIFDLVRSAYNGYDIQAIALDEMIRLHDLFDANVAIGVPGGREVIYLRVLETKQSLGGVQRPGMRDPIHCSASGKAILAYYPDKITDSLLKDYDFKPFTDRTKLSVGAFKSELKFVRTHGFGKNDREEYDHFLGISAPIFNYVGEPIAVLNLWSTYPRHEMDDMLKWSTDLKTSAARVTELIGGVEPSLEDLST
ncbi:MAG: IclR family transcriptional regulator [Paracoccaceae bacterium]